MKLKVSAIFLWFSCTLCIYSQNKNPPEVVSKAVESVYSVDWSNDGSFFVTAWANNIIVWNASDNTIRAVCTGHQDEILSVKISEDSKWLLSVGSDNNVIVRNLANEESRLTIKGKSKLVPVRDAAFVSDGYSILAPMDGSNIYSCFKLQATKSYDFAIIKRKSDEVKSINVSPDKSLFLAMYGDGTVDVTSIVSKKIIASFPRYVSSRIAPVFMKDGNSFISAADKNSLVISYFDGSVSRVLHDMDGFVNSVAVNNDGTKIAAALKNGTVKIYDVETFAVERIYRLSKNDTALSLAFSPDSEFLVAGTKAGYVLRWSINGKPVSEREKVPPPDLNVVTEVIQDHVIFEDKDGNAVPLNDGNNNIVVPPFDSISLNTGYIHIPSSYFTGSFLLEFNYRNYRLYPFFLGVDGLLSIALPSKSFPYSYVANGNKVNAPSVYTAAPAISMGLSYYFVEQKTIVFCEVNTGPNVRVLCNNNLDYLTYSKPFVSGFAEINCGFQYKLFRLSGGAQYDTNYGFTYKAAAGFCVNLKREDFL